MAIYEKTLIDPDRILQHDHLVVDGVDVSGSWNTMITPANGWFSYQKRRHSLMN